MSEKKLWFVRLPQEPEHTIHTVDADTIEDAVRKFGIETCFGVEMASQDTEILAAAGYGEWRKFHFHVEPIPQFTVTEKKDGE